MQYESKLNPDHVDTNGALSHVPLQLNKNRSINEFFKHYRMTFKLGDVFGHTKRGVGQGQRSESQSKTRHTSRKLKTKLVTTTVTMTVTNQEFTYLLILLKKVHATI